MFSDTEAQELLQLPKVVTGNNYVDLGNTEIRLHLQLKEDEDQKFILDIKASNKKAFKISLHHMDERSKIGLLRIDYKGRHVNPDTLLDNIPAEYHPFAGTWINEPHIHNYFSGYKPLAWALPLNVKNFPVLDVTSSSDYVQAVIEFAKAINLETALKVQSAL
jgi:hypothetical protein